MQWNSASCELILEGYDAGMRGLGIAQETLVDAVGRCLMTKRRCKDPRDGLLWFYDAFRKPLSSSREIL